MINISPDFLYWPELDDYLGDSVVFRVSVYWNETYAGLHALGNFTQAAPNVSPGLINAMIEVVDPGGSLARCPVGVIDPFGPFAVEWSLSLNPKLGVGVVAPSESERIPAAGFGLLVWQSYRLHLGMQARKLAVFGERGIPAGTDLP